MPERNVRQSIISVLEPLLNGLNITFGALPPQKVLKKIQQGSSRGMCTTYQKSHLGELNMLEICKDLKISSESGKTNSSALKKINEDYIKISYQTGLGQFTPSPFKVPRFIPLNKITFQTFGLIQAECTKKLTCASFDFSNTDVNVVQFVIDYFKKIWNIPRKSWKLYVEYWRGEVNKVKEEKIKRYWAQRLSISSQRIRVRIGTKRRWSKRAAPFGTAAIRLNNKIAHAVLMRVLGRIKIIAESDPKAAGWYLCGLFAGDGVILQERKRKTPTAVGLSFNPKSIELDHYTRVFAQIGLYVHKDELNKKKKRVILFHHWCNYYSLLRASEGELFLPRRMNATKFCKGFLANQYVTPLLRLKFFENHSATVREFAKAANVCKRAANGDLNRCVTLGFLKRDGGGTTSSPFTFSLSENGKTFLKIVKKIEKFKGATMWGAFDVQ